ncbi:MAG: cob(I)yrinic acid a,c-diamide adenosyltransferase [Bacteroidales bacterium]|nr:cob(I)yrinic acid a,c-diamide adenosyltransferase [Bacteroidales bacterium]
MEKGLVHIYTGDGKGKTTAAAGLALRALGHGLTVCYAYFHKRPERYGYTEVGSLKKLGVEVHGIAEGHPFFDKDIVAGQHAELTEKQFKELVEHVRNQQFDLLILDEVIVSVHSGFLPEKLLTDFISSKPENLELVLTGRDATANLIGLADYVSEIRKVKHPYDKKISAREGIEY